MTTKTADKDTATELPKLAPETRYVLLVVSGAQRNNERLHVVEFRSSDNCRAAKRFLESFAGKFSVWSFDDSV